MPPVVDLSEYISFYLYFCFAEPCFIWPYGKKSISYFNNLELGHKMRGRPEKRVGGGGYGHYKNMNNDERKPRTFKIVDSKNMKKFTR